MNAVTSDFDDWRNMVTATCGYFTITPKDDQTFVGDIRLGRFGSMDIAEISGNVARIEKTNRDVARSDDANLFLILGVEGEAVLEQHGASARLGVGDICLIDSRRPSEFRYDRQFKQISVHLPEMQTMEIFGADEIPFAKIIPSRRNSALRASILDMYHHAHVDEEGVSLSPQHSQWSEKNEECLTLLRQIIVGDEHGGPGNEFNIDQCRRINQYIENNLRDAELDLNDIARAGGMSRRSLYRLFERKGLSPSNWIRMRRLELARNDLMHLSADDSCTEIAFRYGFNSSAHFSRMFKQKFGLSPNQLKKQSRYNS